MVTGFLPSLLRLMEGLGAHWSVNKDRDMMATKYVGSFSPTLFAASLPGPKIRPWNEAIHVHVLSGSEVVTMLPWI